MAREAEPRPGRGGCRRNGRPSARSWTLASSSSRKSKSKRKKPRPTSKSSRKSACAPRPTIHDIETKVNQARKFLEHKDKVLVYVLFKGREMQHIEEGKRIIGQDDGKAADLAKVEKEPSMEGKRMTTMLAPK